MTDYAGAFPTNFAGAQNTNTRGTTGEQNGTEFYVTSRVWLKGMRFYRLNTNISGTVNGGLFQVSTAALVSGTTGTWTLSGTGWLSYFLATPVLLATNTRYRAAVQWGTNRVASTNNDYFGSAGPGANGHTNGPLVIPPRAQGTNNYTAWYVIGSSLAYPNTGGTFAYPVDPIVTDTNPFARQAAFFPFFGT